MDKKHYHTSAQLEHVNPFRVMTVMHRAAELEAQGRKIVHMEVGEPDFTTAQPIIDAAKQALNRGLTQYTAAPGIVELREAIVEHYNQRHGVSLDKNQVLITPGASGGLTLLAHLLVEQGDGILLSDPAYPCVRNFIHLMNATPQLVPVGLAENFQPSVKQLQEHANDHTRGVWLASPSNPTGTILERDQLHSIASWAADSGYHLLVDEIYHGLHYVQDLPSILEIDSSAHVVNSFSKYFGMTGWRLGWIVVPEPAIEKANILAQNLYISASSIAQHAALAAFEPATQKIFEQRRAAFKERGDFLSTALKDLGFELSENIQGAFYVYADISNFSEDAEAFCRMVLEDHGVAVTPGTDFGEHSGSRYVRFAFTTSMEDLELGVERLALALNQ